MADNPLKREGVDNVVPEEVVRRVRIEQHVMDLRAGTARVLLSLFAFAVVATYTLIFLWGYRRIDLPSPFVHWLGAATVGQIVGLLGIVVRSLFPTIQVE